MNCYQYKIVCQVKFEVLTLTNHIQVLTLQNLQKGAQATDFSAQYTEKLRFLQDLLISNNIRPENFNLTDFAAECLRNADIQMHSYINSCNALAPGNVQQQ
ncbi:hypothetical protein GCK72_008902 [Caenorhabditis remanei]|uniref:Uncharacterized protein n=1 Tax=Caenorhabditis remanei TaxID=31234 RepID=A0A6A5H236_CAERE|nr:hypothetical protein GCK72_008902 [Caenorhabditis remanei]KAF1760653.1 hypothetical protein GCK72_008902 [Caenorhabditis remanei]